MTKSNTDKTALGGTPDINLENPSSLAASLRDSGEVNYCLIRIHLQATL